MEVFLFVRDFIRTKGWPPSIAEVGAHFGMQANAADGHLRALIKKGWLFRNPHKARSLRVADDIK